MLDFALVLAGQASPVQCLDIHIVKVMVIQCRCGLGGVMALVVALGAASVAVLVEGGEDGEPMDTKDGRF